jgi:hypothetical protein
MSSEESLLLEATKTCTKCKRIKPLTEFHKDKRKADEYSCSCKICRNKIAENYRKNNKEKISLVGKERYENNKEKIKKYQYDNKELISNRKQKRYQKNKVLVIKKNTAYQTARRKVDPLFKLMCNLRTLIGNSMKNGGFTKTTKTAQILGCSFDEFKVHIENQFAEGMSWDNHGEWHYDHVTPISWGQTEQEIIALNHFSNFQPLWEEDNLKKGNRFSG